MAEELWSMLGSKNTIAYEPWPAFNEEYLKEELFEYPVSFNGKLRFKVELPLAMPKEEIISIVLADPRAAKWLEGKAPSNIVVVPGRIINIVIK